MPSGRSRGRGRALEPHPTLPTKPEPEQKKGFQERVYEAFNPIFIGELSRLRQLKPIKTVVDRHSENHRVRDVIEEFGFDAVCLKAKKLLKEDAFSTAAEMSEKLSRKAKKRNKALQIKLEHMSLQDGTPDEEAQQSTEERDANENEGLYPDHYRSPPQRPLVFLPLRTQYRILSQVQTIMEQVCFEFSKRLLPDLLREKNWECAESAQLSVWGGHIENRRRRVDLPRPRSGKTLHMLFLSMKTIQETNEKRTRIVASDVLELVRDAAELCELLSQRLFMDSLKKISREIEVFILELDTRNSELVSKIDETSKHFEEQRLGLVQREAQAISHIRKEHERNQDMVGTRLEQSLIAQFSPGFSGSPGQQ